MGLLWGLASRMGSPPAMLLDEAMGLGNAGTQSQGGSLPAVDASEATGLGNAETQEASMFSSLGGPAEGADNVGTQAAPPVPRTVDAKGGRGYRRRISPEEMRLLKEGREKELGGIYVGRVIPWKGTRSIWSNPFRMGQDGDRGQVVKKFRDWFPSSEVAREVGCLKGKVSLCHCT